MEEEVEGVAEEVEVVEAEEIWSNLLSIKKIHLEKTDPKNS
jgi:hypothetical protein